MGLPFTRIPARKGHGSLLVTRDPSMGHPWRVALPGNPRIEPANYPGIAAFVEVFAFAQQWYDRQTAAFVSWVCGWSTGNGFDEADVVAGCEKWHSEPINMVRILAARQQIPLAMPNTKASTAYVVKIVGRLHKNPATVPPSDLKMLLSEPIVVDRLAALTIKRYDYSSFALPFTPAETDPWRKDE